MSTLTRKCRLALFLICAGYSAHAHGQTYSDIVLAGNPLFYWNFNEAGDLDPALDLVGSDAGDNLLPEGNATRAASSTTTGGLTLGRAASFDGTQFSKFYSGALTPPSDADAWAIEMWVRPTGPDPGDRFDYILEARGNGVNSPGILFDYGNNDKVEVFGGGGRTADSGPSLTNDGWQHLVMGNFGVDNDRIDFYRNGVAAGSVAYTQSVPFGTNQIAVGNSVPGNANFDHFAGLIDELAVYDLTGQSVSQINSKLLALATHYNAATGGILGDANKDGVVNGLDFELISTNLFTTQTPGGGGDLDLDSYVDFMDFRIWKNAAPPEIAAMYNIPEPTSVALIFIGMAGVWRRRRSR